MFGTGNSGYSLPDACVAPTISTGAGSFPAEASKFDLIADCILGCGQTNRLGLGSYDSRIRSSRRTHFLGNSILFAERVKHFFACSNEATIAVLCLHNSHIL
jgi:hypothetical protein